MSMFFGEVKGYIVVWKIGTIIVGIRIMIRSGGIIRDREIYSGRGGISEIIRLI